MTVPGVPVDLVFQSIGPEDGVLTESTETSGLGGVASVVGDNLQVGDHLGDRQVKGVLSFDTSAIPDGATIVSATVRVRRVGLWGGNPFADLGVCTFDVRSGGFGGDPALQPGDFEASASAPGAGTLTSPVANGDWSSGALNAAGLAAIDRTGRTQVRMAFALDDNDNGLVDRVRYGAGEHADAASRPELIVTVLE